MTKFWIYIPWATRNVVEVEIVKETPQRYYLKLVKTILGITSWIPEYTSKDEDLFFDTAEEALVWCESEAALNFSRAQQVFIDRMKEIKGARDKL